MSSFAAFAQEIPVRPYVDPNLINLSWGQRSFYRQPWRSYCETRSGYDFLNGIGINYNLTGNDDLAVRVLANCGIKVCRLEIGWGTVKMDETGFTNGPRLAHLMSLFKQYGIRPTFLLNAHHGNPVPMTSMTKTVAQNTPAGSPYIVLNDVTNVIPAYTGISNLTQYMAAQVIVTRMDSAANRCWLSKPLPVALKAGTAITMVTLKYLPLYNVGSSTFDQTAVAWARYAMLVCKLARDAGIPNYDLEIWNELTFGSAFLDIDNYYSPPITQKASLGIDPLMQGGRAWELANRTVKAVKPIYPEARIIWGYSNISPFHTPIEWLPPGIDGQSAHPYGTSTISYPNQEQQANMPWQNVDNYTPTMEARTPEGWMQTYDRTDSIIRLLTPDARTRRPPATNRFYHYFTEHGVHPDANGATTEAAAWDMKTLTALRSYTFWLNKGVDVVEMFCAQDTNPLGMGYLPANFPSMPANSTDAQVMTPTLKAIQNLTWSFSNSQPLQPRQLWIDVIAIGQQNAIFPGDAKHPPLWNREMVAALPFQINQYEYMVSLYTMTMDMKKRQAGEQYRITVSNLHTRMNNVIYFDPSDGSWQPVTVTWQDWHNLQVIVPITDSPRMLIMWV